jgi:rhodanese-related sulfurtransferase
MAANRISPEEAYALVLAGELVIFLDTRNPQAWATSDVKIPGAIRVPANEVESHFSEIDPDSTVIAYCT